MDTDVQHILLPCAICARTFKPQSLEKHSKICERQANKKRKPFDSAKQRIQGTELAEFLPKQEKKRYLPDDRLSKPKSAWKETHDDFLRAIRAARNEIVATPMQKQCGTMVTSSAPTRSNEQGTCPTCNRHFGVKAYERHVAWCKDRVTRVPVSPATNIAKERLEARMKYRAPAVKSRRQVTREKYSPGSAITLNSASKTSPTLATVKAKESASVPSCNKSNSPVKQKSFVRRPGQTKESSVSHVPMKSRQIDRANRQPEDKPGPLSLRPAPPVKRTSYLPVPPLKHTIDILEESDSIPSPTSCKRQGRSRKVRERVKNKQEEKHSARSPKTNIVSARSQGNPKVNDVSINADIVGVTVKPCNIYTENTFTTWKQISQEKGYEPDNSKKYIKAQTPFRNTDLCSLDDQNVKEFSLDTGSFERNNKKYVKAQKPFRNTDLCSPDDQDVKEFSLDTRSFERNNKKYVKTQKPFRNTDLCSLDDQDVKEFSLDAETFVQDKLKIALDEDICKDDKDRLSSRSGSLNWSMISSQLNQTYSFKDLTTNDEIDEMKMSKRKWKPVKHSPRVEFCLGDPEKANRVCSSSLKFIYPDESKRASRTSSRNGKNERTGSKDSEVENERLENETEDLNFNISKRLTPTAYADFSSQNDFEFQTANSQENLEKNDALDGELNSTCIKEKNAESVSARENSEVKEENWKENLRYFLEQKSTSNEFKTDETIVDDDMPEANQLTLLDDGSEKEMMDTENNKKDNDEFHSCVKNLDQSLQNETEYSTKNDYTDVTKESCNIENNFVEVENYQFSKDMLLPTRSSTPFLNVEEYSDPKSEIYENSVEESYQPPAIYEWKMAIDVDTGSEVLYRLESRDSNCSRRSSRSKVNKSKRNNSGNQGSLNSSENNENSLSLPSISSVPSARIRKKETGTYPLNLSSHKTLKKETASQINTCNCSPNVSAVLKCEKAIDCNDLIRNISESETQNLKQKEYVDEPIVANNPFKEAEFLEEQSNENLEDTSTCKQEYTDAANDNYLNEESKEEIQEIYKTCKTKDFDYDSDNSVEQHMREAINNLKASSNKRSIVLSESCVRVRKSSTTSKSYRSRILEMQNKIHENILNESSDSLGSSVNGVDFADTRQVESVEVETIEEIGTRNRSIRFRILPEIKGTTMVVKENRGEREKIDARTYWEKASKASKNRLINLDPPYQGASRFYKRNPKVRILPPVPSGSSLVDHSGKGYDPFLLADQQMNDLLSDTSEQSVTDIPIEKNRETSFPLSHSSAFVKYPCQSSLSSPEKRSSLIAPPTEFDDLVSDFSSDSTETNSLSREIFLKDLKESISRSDVDKKSPVRELGRRVIIDKSKALGGEVVDDGDRGSRSFVASSERARKILDKVSPKVIRPSVNRSLSVRASSAPKTTPDRKTLNDSKKSRKNNEGQNSLNNRNNNYANLSSSNLSLSSIVSSDVDIKRSNSLFDELMTSFDDENGSFSSLKSLLKNDSLSSPIHGRHRNGQISDEELSSPESYKRQDHSKLSADSAYSSLNRKYSHHGRSTNDVAGRLEEDLPRCNRRDGDGITNTTKCKMSKYCHECGSKFPETAKFCCECGIRRLVL